MDRCIIYKVDRKGMISFHNELMNKANKYNMDDEQCKEAYPLTPAQATRPTYSVEVTLGDKYYNKEVDRWIFPWRNNVYVSTSNVVEFTDSDLYDIRQIITFEGVSKLTLKNLSWMLNNKKE
jgi:hypothetical protein